jgi:hypothetical protein
MKHQQRVRGVVFWRNSRARSAVLSTFRAVPVKVPEIILVVVLRSWIPASVTKIPISIHLAIVAFITYPLQASRSDCVRRSSKPHRVRRRHASTRCKRSIHSFTKTRSVLHTSNAIRPSLGNSRLIRSMKAFRPPTNFGSRGSTDPSKRDMRKGSKSKTRIVSREQKSVHELRCTHSRGRYKPVCR